MPVQRWGADWHLAYELYKMGDQRPIAVAGYIASTITESECEALADITSIGAKTINKKLSEVVSERGVERDKLFSLLTEGSSNVNDIFSTLKSHRKLQTTEGEESAAFVERLQKVLRCNDVHYVFFTSGTASKANGSPDKPFIVSDASFLSYDQFAAGTHNLMPSMCEQKSWAPVVIDCSKDVL